MAVFYPKSISELYRLVTSWQRVHLRKCRNLPPSVRESYTALKENDKTRGKTQYWVTSAKALGLMDCVSKAGGIRFSQAPAGLPPASAIKATRARAVEAAPSVVSVPSMESTESSSSCEASSEALTRSVPPPPVPAVVIHAQTAAV